MVGGERGCWEGGDLRMGEEWCILYMSSFLG